MPDTDIKRSVTLQSNNLSVCTFWRLLFASLSLPSGARAGLCEKVNKTQAFRTGGINPDTYTVKSSPRILDVKLKLSYAL